MSFRLKTILGIGFIEAILLLILITTSINLLKNTKEAELVKLANNTAQLFATTTKDAVLSTDIAALESFVTEVMKNSGLIYARVYSNSAGLLAQSARTGQSVNTFHADTSVAQVTDGIFDTMAHIAESDFVYGRVELGFDIAEVDALVKDARQKTLIIAAIELALSALFSATLGLYLTRQLKELKLASQKIMRGELGFQIRVQGKDEIAQTAQTFNHMSANLHSIWQEREKAQADLVALNEDLENQVAARTKQLEEAQQHALEQAHRAGMADIAAGALHNIGNLINSAKTNATLLKQTMNESKISSLQQANDLLQANMHQIDTFIANDPKGKQLLNYYLKIGDSLSQEQQALSEKLQDITQSIELTAQTIAEQQAVARNPLRFETQVDVGEIFSDVLNLLKLRIQAQNVKVIENYEADLPFITTQKNKLHQVLFNLVINALDAMDANVSADCNVHCEKQLSLNIAQQMKNDQAWLKIAVTDSGCGIAADRLDTIFHYGQTSKATGNGAGLHSSANLVDEMQGKLEVSSQGVGLGASFCVYLPIFLKNTRKAV